MSFVRLLACPFVCLALAACGGASGPGGGSQDLPALGQPPTEILVVTNHDDDGPGSLRQAVIDAPPGAWITFDPALPAGTIDLETPLEVGKVLTIGGLAGDGTRHEIFGQVETGIFVVEGGALQLNDLKLSGGLMHAVDGGRGGAILALGAQVICWRVAFWSSIADDNGGAIYIEDGALEVYDASFEWNWADTEYGGGVAAVDSTVRIERTTFWKNSAYLGGGAISVRGGDTILVNVAMHVNDAELGGGGAIRARTDASSTPATVLMLNTTITDNEASHTGGGLHLEADDGVPIHLDMHRSIVALNSAPGSQDMEYDGASSTAGGHNLIGIGGGMFANGLDGNHVGDAVTPFDPELLALFTLPDGRRVRLPLPASPAVDAVPAGQNPNPEGLPMVFDLRLLPRDPLLPSDIGAIEL